MVKKEPMNKKSKKIGLLTKEKVVVELKEKIVNSQGCFFVKFNKLDAFSLNVLRNDLKDSQTGIIVTKNTLFQKALKELDYKESSEFFDGETGLVMTSSNDIVAVCKILVDFSKEKPNLKVKGGLIKDKEISAEEVIVLSKLPSKEVLLGMAVRGLASPISGLLSCFNQVVLKFVWAIEEIKKVKEK